MSNGLAQFYSDASDGILVRQVAAGEDAALACLLMRYKPLLCSAVGKLCTHPFDYDDLYQEATLGLLKAIKSYNSEKGSFSAFAKLCVESELFTYIRSLRRKSNIPANHLVELKDAFQMPHSDPQDIYIDREEADDIKKRMKNSLSDFEFKIIHHYIMGKSYEEIAEDLGIPIKSVDNAIQRVRRKLK